MCFEFLGQFGLLLTIAAFVCLGAGVLLYCVPMWRVTRAAHHNAPTNVAADKLPKATVVVYARNDAECISALLDSILSQDYPDYEVIVVTDASTDGTVDIIEQAQNLHPNLLHTFVPTESHNLSRKKLAIMLGIKGSTGDVIVTTTATAVITSDQWLKQMCEPFANKHIELTLGYCNTLYREAGGAGSRYRCIDTLLTGTQWLNAALSGRPYRGDGHNLAYRRDTFFSANGFSQTMWAQNGDDDLFVNQICTAGNTAVCLSPGAIIGTHCCGRGSKTWLDDKEKYMFTQHYLPRRPFMMHALGGWAYWLGSLSCIAGILAGVSGMWWWCAANGALLLMAWCCMALSYRHVSNTLHAGRQLITVPFTLYIRPLVNATLRLRFSSRKGCNYTWRH